MAMQRGDEPQFEQLLPSLWRVGGGSWGCKDLANLALGGESNVYVMKLPDAPVMTDCGSIEAMPLIEENIPAAGLNPEDVTDMVMPHSHADHTEAAREWRAKYGVRTHLDFVGADYMARGDSCLLGHVRDNESRFTYAPFVVDHVVQDEEEFDLAGAPVKAYHMPGHTPDCMLFVLEFDGRQVGICGDICFGPADWGPGPSGIGAGR